MFRACKKDLQCLRISGRQETKHAACRHCRQVTDRLLSVYPALGASVQAMGMWLTACRTHLATTPLAHIALPNMLPGRISEQFFAREIGPSLPVHILQTLPIKLTTASSQARALRARPMCRICPSVRFASKSGAHKEPRLQKPSSPILRFSAISFPTGSELLRVHFRSHDPLETPCWLLKDLNLSEDLLACDL